MKKHFLIGIIAFITFNCIGCSNEDFSNDYPTDLKSNIPKEYEIIGEMHNQGLKYAFDSLRSYYTVKKLRSKGSTVKNLTKDEVQRLMTKAVLNFAEKDSQQFFIKTIKSNSSEWDSSIPIDSLLQKKVVLSENITFFLDKIKHTLKQHPKSSEELLHKLNKINEEAQSVLSEQELVAIYAGTSTCYHSYQYWKDNYLKWELTLKHPNLAAKYTEEEINQLVIHNGKIMPSKKVRSDDKEKNWWATRYIIL